MLRANWRVAVTCLALMLAACSPSKVTLDNYKKLDWTMTRQQVYAVFGEPSDVDKPAAGANGDTTVETWHGNGHDLLTITFVDGKLAMKSLRSKGVDY